MIFDSISGVSIELRSKFSSRDCNLVKFLGKIKKESRVLEEDKPNLFPIKWNFKVFSFDNLEIDMKIEFISSFRIL